MNKISLYGKLRLKTIARYSAGLLLVSLCAAAVATNFFGTAPKTEAAIDCNPDGHTVTLASASSLSANRHDFCYTINEADADVTVQSGAIFKIYGSHTFRSLTVYGEITTDGLEPTTDFDPVTGQLVTGTTNRGVDRKIDITVAGDIKILNDGKINATGKGYPSYPANDTTSTYTTRSYPYYLPLLQEGALGFNMFMLTADACLPANSGKNLPCIGQDRAFNVGGGGGGGYASGGNSGWTDSTGVNTFYNSSGQIHNVSMLSSPAPGGAGGFAIGAKGYAGIGPNGDGAESAMALGGSGGGVIILKANKVVMDNSSSITANGADGNKVTGTNTIVYRIQGGGGGGGYIGIDSNYFYGSLSPGYIETAGGDGVCQHHSYSGTDKPCIGVDGPLDTHGISPLFGGRISARGGSGNIEASLPTLDSFWGGGGGGGKVDINIHKEYLRNCIISNLSTPNDRIPAECENQDVVVDNTTVYANRQDYPAGTGGTKRSFNSLIIRNNAVVTHDPVMASDITSGTANNSNKQVNFVIANDLTLESGSSINVDGKGYPALDKTTCGNLIDNTDTLTGYGPGGGKGGIKNGSPVGGGGGSYGGVGGGGVIGATLTGLSSTYGSIDLPGAQFEFGSAGGSACNYNGNYVTNGSAGGGRIWLEVGNLKINSFGSYISANGGDSSYVNQRQGGAGSGGSIRVKITGNNSNYSFTYSVQPGSQDSTEDDTLLPQHRGGAGAAGTIKSTGNIQISNVFGANIRANGGNTNLPKSTDGYIPGGTGGGGRIYISAPDSGLSISKKLEAVERNGVSNTTYDPYALQLKDVIKVTITIPNLNSGDIINVEDTYLATSETTPKRCVYQGSSVSYLNLSESNPPLASLSGVTFQVLATGTGDRTISYNCKVQN